MSIKKPRKYNKSPSTYAAPVDGQPLGSYTALRGNSNG
nr:MAG TPA: hypothetical protein [Caudoviricetes sp.]